MNMAKSVKKSPMAEDMIIGANLRRIRQARGVTQETLGEAVNITFQQIQKYEKGTNRIGGSRMVQFSRVLNCEICDFFIGLTGDHQSTPLPLFSKAALEVATLVETLPARQKIALRNLVTSLTGQAEPYLVAAE
jgi:transcriptional regulator with XRE-family HTH domain